MKEIFVFDSFSKMNKKPFGAIKCGEKVFLSASALCTEVFSVSVLVYSEYEGTEREIEMFWSKRNGDCDIYCIETDVYDKCGIFWYCFKIRKTDGQCVYYGKNGFDSNVESVARFQQTVFCCEYETPEWFSEGVTYHIFVDRFNRGEASPEIMDDPYFYVHDDKKETPVFKPNEKGVVENRDIYGGNLEGVIDKLPYLKSLGVRTIYLSPVFEAWSNHKYNTADYNKIDSHFGNDKILKKLCSEAEKSGMKVILDGVFSHTGSDSIYFNREGRYGLNIGAWNDKNSEFSPWFNISPDGKYSSWWGIDTLPQVDEMNREYRDFIINSENSVISKWMKCGVAGWRLDVADELPDEFIDELKKRAIQENKEALVIGEVWEDASTKKAYGVSKKYFTCGVLDGVMNYPLKNAILDFLCGRISAQNAATAMLAIIENYPDVSQRCLMNIIGTHDTVRAINELSVGSMHYETKEFRAERKLCSEEYKLGKKRLLMAATIQYMFPGSPCIYYGDEIGMQGFEDPFNRRYFEWDNIDNDILSFYQKLGDIKTQCISEDSECFKVLYAKDDILVVARGGILAYINRGSGKSLLKVMPNSRVLLCSGICEVKAGKILLSPQSCCIIEVSVNKTL